MLSGTVFTMYSDLLNNKMRPI